MTRLRSPNLARDLETLFNNGPLAQRTDTQLLDELITRQSHPAFEELIARHGPLVMRICRQFLQNSHDIEDAFQATFLILVRKAGSLRDGSSLSSWLYGVARRVACRARKNAQRRRTREYPITTDPADHFRHPSDSNELRAILDQEIARLPKNQQFATIICLCHGHTHEAAARQLNWPLGTLKSRIATARQTLTTRLTRRGFTPSGIAILLRPTLEPIPVQLIQCTLETATSALANPVILPVPIASLIHQAMRSMFLARIEFTSFLLIFTSTCIAYSTATALNARQATPAPKSSLPPESKTQPVKVDRDGNPLPPGAVIRIGTTRFRHERSINNIAYSPNSLLLATDDYQRSIQLWNSKTGQKIRRIDSGFAHISDFAFSPDGKTIAIVGSGNTGIPDVKSKHLTFIDIATGEPERSTEWRQGSEVTRIIYAPDGKTVATSDHGSFRLWDAATLQVLHQDGPDAGARTWIAFSPDVTSHLMAVARDDKIRLWNTTDRQTIRTITINHRGGATRPSFSPNGATLAARIGPNVLGLYKVSDGTLIRRFIAPLNSKMIAPSFSPDGKILAGVDRQPYRRSNLTFFETETGMELNLLADVATQNAPILFSPDGSTITTTAGEQVLHFWDRATGKDRLEPPEAHLDFVSFLTFIHGGNTLVSCCNEDGFCSDQTLRHWNITTGRLSKTLPRNGAVRSWAVAADGSPVALTWIDRQQKAQLCNLDTGVTVQTWSIADANAGSRMADVALTQDATTMIATSANGSLRSWNTSTGKEQPISQPTFQPDQEKHRTAIDRLRLSPDGQTLVLSDQNWTYFFDRATGNFLFKVSALTQEPDAAIRTRIWATLQFAPDGRTFAVPRDTYNPVELPNGKTRFPDIPSMSTIVWRDTRTGHIRREIDIPDCDIGPLAFSPDGKWIAAVTRLHGDQPIVRIFRLRDKHEIRTIKPISSAWITALAFTPDGSQLATALADTSVILWDVRTNK